MKPISFTQIIPSLIFSSLTTAAVARAQIIPDNTLPDASIVEAGCTVCTITGGTARGGNLFHSFREFSVPTGGEALFNSSPQVENILTRVTGSSISNIDGLLRSPPNTNLFLINPNGVIFGPNARLDVGGSFLASTADAIAFPNGDVFSATNPTSPTALLTVNPNALLFNQLNPRSIINRSTANSIGLSVANGRSLLLAGGDVRLERGQLAAPGGRIELGGLSEPGVLGLAVNNFSLEFPINAGRADVSVNRSLIDVVSGGGGSIAITTRNLNVLDSSAIVAGIGGGVGTLDRQAGDIEINATGAIAIESSGILNDVRSGFAGRGGNIRINARSLLMTNGAQLVANTNGQGDAGSIFIDVYDAASLDSTRSDGNSSTGIFSNVEESGVGQGGSIYIAARSLSVTNGAGLNTLTSGQGNSGSILIDVSDTVSFGGTAPDSTSSTSALSLIFSAVQPGGVGRGGDVRITARSLSVSNSAQVAAGTQGQGDSGNVFIDVRDTISLNQGYVISSVGTNAVGQGGNILINTSFLSLTNAGQLISGSRGQGNAGNIVINARRVSFDGTLQLPSTTTPDNVAPSGAFSSVSFSGTGQGGDIRIVTDTLSVTNGAQLVASTFGRGNAGNISIDARDTVLFDGSGLGGRRFSGAFSSVQPNVIGNGGSIRITTGSLSLRNGAVLRTATFGQGNAGNISIDARDTVSFDGTGLNGAATGANSSVQPSGIGQGGDIRITTGALSVTNGAQLSTSTFGRGDAGSLFINARDTVSFSDTSPDSRFPTGAFSSVEPTSTGRGRDINITAGVLSLTDGSVLNASSAGTEGAGNINVNAPIIRLDQSRITSETTSGDGGDIALTVRDLLLLRRSGIVSTTAGTTQAGGDGGNITFNDGFIIAVSSEDSNIAANAFTGSGGRVDITAQGIFGIEPRLRATPLSDITASSEFGIAGTVIINTPNTDLDRELAELPTDVVDASRLVAVGCTSPTAARTNRGEFYRTGRGGIAPLPTDALGSSDILEDFQPPDTWTSATPSEPSQEAEGWQVNQQGQVVLVTSTQLRRCRR